jgi:hypothetical protein
MSMAYRRSWILLFAALSAACAGGEGSAPDVADPGPAFDPGPVDPGLSTDSTPADPGVGDPGPADSAPDVPPPDVQDIPVDLPDPSVIPATPGARCPLSERIARVTVEGYVQPGTEIQASAEVFDRPDPLTGDPKLSDATCAFYSHASAWCDPPCPADQSCVTDGKCEPVPAPVWDATLVLSDGTGTQAFGKGSPTGKFYGPVTLSGRTFSATLSWAGRTVTLEPTALPGGLAGLSGHCDDSMAPEFLDLTWTIPADGGQVHTLIPINHHAAGPTFTDCVAEASAGKMHVDGAMLKPLSVVTGLEFQGIEHVRFAAAVTPEGCVEFRFQVPQMVDFVY